MGYRLLADEHVEPLLRRELYDLGHDVEWVGDVGVLGLGASDTAIAAYARREDRLILTRDDDFVTDIDPEEMAGVLFLRDASLSDTEVATIIDRLCRYIPQADVDLEYVSRNWL